MRVMIVTRVDGAVYQQFRETSRPDIRRPAIDVDLLMSERPTRGRGRGGAPYRD